MRTLLAQVQAWGARHCGAELPKRHKRPQPLENGLDKRLQRVAGLLPALGRLGNFVAFQVDLPQCIDDAAECKVVRFFRIEFFEGIGRRPRVVRGGTWAWTPSGTLRRCLREY